MQMDFRQRYGRKSPELERRLVVGKLTIGPDGDTSGLGARIGAHLSVAS